MDDDQRKRATPKAPPKMAMASTPKLRVRKLSPPFWSLGLDVLDEAAVSPATMANEVIVVALPSGSVEVKRTKLEMATASGVKVVTNVEPFASVAVTT